MTDEKNKEEEPLLEWWECDFQILMDERSSPIFSHNAMKHLLAESRRRAISEIAEMVKGCNHSVDWSGEFSDGHSALKIEILHRLENLDK